MTKTRLLIVDQDKLTQKSLYELLCRSGYEVETAGSIQESLTYLNKDPYQVILTGINGADGNKLLKIIKEKSYPAEVIVLTSYGNIELAVTSIKMGAFDYLVRPIENKKILSTIERALSNKPLINATPTPIKRLSGQDTTHQGLVGNSFQIKEIYSLVERISNAKTTVFLRGESGTGKRLVAHAIHQADKKRKDNPFIEVACGALSRGIVESELFGHAKGSFTDAIRDHKGRFESAHGGTILLDDIDALTLELQVKLLRVLQHKEFERLGDHKTIKVDLRIIVATNHNLEKAVAEGRFREDLYYRINVISINIPPLRERKEDIALLVEHFVKLYAKENFKTIKGISRDALQMLSNYRWPGNIRELENIVERAIILDTDGVIARDDLPEIILNESMVLHPSSVSDKQGGPVTLKDALREPEKVYILKVLKEVGGNKKKAARKLGVNRTTLYNKLRKYNLLPSVDK
ncbi:MAG: sigma-54 dependent transcriptional regulator [Omnitrophica bacterium]|nr:sigma-54 dependent transcriptional regulator [Candidatus Omnitrophota bacterium]